LKRFRAIGISDGTSIDDQTAGGGTQQKCQSHLDAVAIPAERGPFELAAQLIGRNSSLVVAGLGQTSTERTDQRMAIIQCTIIFVHAQILQISIGRVAAQSCLDGRLFIEETIGYLGKTGVDVGKNLAERTTHGITSTFT